MDNIAIIISVAAFTTAVLGPLITTWIKCTHEAKMHQKRFYDEHRHQVIETYLKSVGKYAFTHDANDRREFGEASAEIFMYVPNELWDSIKAINEQISRIYNSDYAIASQEQANLQKSYLELCEQFSTLNRKAHNTKSKKK